MVNKRVDPTQTTVLRERQFRPALTKRFIQLKGAIRKTVGYHFDALELTAEKPSPKEQFEFERGQWLVEEFMSWLRENIEKGVLVSMANASVQKGNHYTATFVKAAARKGWVDASKRLLKAGVNLGDGSLEPSFDLPVEREQLKRLYTRVYEKLRDVTTDMAQAIREELTEGLAEGVNPREMANRLNDRVEKIGIHRAELIARTEIIHSYNEFALTRYERVGVQKVGVEVEFLATNDTRTCPICKSLDNREFDLRDARNGTFSYESKSDEPDSLSGEYPILPPVHPNCRCAVAPII